MTLTDLIARVEKAEEGSRELDAEIYLLRNPDMDREWVYVGFPKDSSIHPTIPHYTTSIDAALTLVPEGWDWGRDETKCVFIYEEIWPIDKTSGRAFAVISKGYPALALCIASLRARIKHDSD